MKSKRRLGAWSVLGWVVVAGLMLTRCDCGDDNDRYCCWFEVDAGEDVDTKVGQEVTLKATVSASSVTYERCNSLVGQVGVYWRQYEDEAPRVALSANDTREVFFTPVESGVYTFCITIEDEICTQRRIAQSDCVYVRVGDYVCSPIADAGEDKIVGTTSGVPQTITLDGSASRPDFACPDSTLSRYTWSVVSQPTGSNVVIQTPFSIQATAELLVLGNYEFQLEVQDSTGGIGTDTVIFTLEQCGIGLLVTAIDARDGTTLEGAHVTVVDAAGDSHTADTNANGVAGFVALEPGTRQSITVVSDETAPPMPGVQGPNRLRYEITTVLNHCAFDVTLPLHLTASGKADEPMGTVVAKVSGTVFDMLPQPQPFFSLGSPEISGQFRVAMLVPVFPRENFTYRDLNGIFAPPNIRGNILPGNMATDETFLSGIGLDEWFSECITVNDCPNSEDYICEQDEIGEYRCKLKCPFCRINVKSTAGQGVQLALVTGIMDASLMESLQVLLPFITGSSDHPDASTLMLSTLRLHTLHICPLSVDVTANVETDITDLLDSLTINECWNVNYHVQDEVVALPGSHDLPPQQCVTDNDCCDAGGNCGWPDSGKKCLPESTPAFCFVPLFRVGIVTSDRIEIQTDLTGFDPADQNADGRLRRWLPTTAPYEVMCPTSIPDVYQSCDPPDIRYMIVHSQTTECSFPYGMSLASLDVPAGHADLPKGGRVFAGFDFNRSPTHYRDSAEFTVPSEILDGSVFFSAVQMVFRNLKRTDSGPFWEMPGSTSTQGRWATLSNTVTLPPFISIPALAPPPYDAGMSVDVTFEVRDPTVLPPSFTRVFATAIGMRMPQDNLFIILDDITESALPENVLKGVVLSRVDYSAAITILDPWWRIYAPADTSDMSLPADLCPFTSGDNAWITPFGAGFGVPFDYDLFPTDVLLGPLSQYSEDSYAVIVP